MSLVVVGDFYKAMWNFKQFFGTPLVACHMLDFCDVLEVYGMSDLELAGPPYTFDDS